MKLLRDWKTFPSHLRAGVLCVGNFDGVHLGHAEMLRTGREHATARKTSFTIMSFDPHPATVLKPHVRRFPLTMFQQRLELLEKFSPDVVIAVPTDRAFLSITAEEFLKTIVRGDAAAGIGATLLVEGPTFTFGRGAKGTVEMLIKQGPSYGFETIIVPTQRQSLTNLTLVKVSSSLIRWLVEQGRVADAARALGRPYAIHGTVVQGARRGKALGFPTANLETMQLVPGPGIYAGHAVVDGLPYRAAISVGNNPTFAADRTTIEAYLLDFQGDLYGRPLEVAFERWVREMQIFAGAAPLAAQIRRDVDATRRIIELKEVG